MPQFNIGNTTASDLTNVVEDYAVTPSEPDGVQNVKETTWQNPNWSWQWGYFTTNADLKSAILMKAVWNVGRGYTCDPRTLINLKMITGWGKDTFDDIIFNMDVVRRVSGDSYAEIVRDKKSGILVNLKPLNPGSMRHVINEEGRIIRYEQTSRIPGNSTVKKFQPDEIFHLSHNRLADQIHGISDIDALEEVIKAEDENFADMKKLIHRQARPMIMFKIKSDDQSTLTSFISKMDQATNKGENIYVPNDENTIEWEVIQVNPSSIVMQWRDDIRNKFYRTIGLPQVVPGAGGQSTESESKVIYLAFEQIVEKEQRYLEQQIYAQLGLEINFEPPASLLNNLNTDTSKDSGNAVQPSDVTAGMGR